MIGRSLSGTEDTKFRKPTNCPSIHCSIHSFVRSSVTYFPPFLCNGPMEVKNRTKCMLTNLIDHPSHFAYKNIDRSECMNYFFCAQIWHPLCMLLCYGGMILLSSCQVYQYVSIANTAVLPPKIPKPWQTCCLMYAVSLLTMSDTLDKIFSCCYSVIHHQDCSGCPESTKISRKIRIFPGVAP